MHAFSADERGRSSTGNTARNMYRHRKTIFLANQQSNHCQCRNVFFPSPFLRCSRASCPRGEGGQLADDPRSGIDVSHAQHELSFPSDNLFSKRATLKLARGTVAIARLFAIAAGVVFLVLQCFRAVTSGRIKKNQGATARRVAEGERASCSVSHHVERTAHIAASPVLPVPAAVSGRLYSRRYIAAQKRRTPHTFRSRVHA